VYNINYKGGKTKRLLISLTLVLVVLGLVVDVFGMNKIKIVEMATSLKMKTDCAKFNNSHGIPSLIVYKCSLKKEPLGPFYIANYYIEVEDNTSCGYTLYLMKSYFLDSSEAVVDSSFNVFIFKEKAFKTLRGEILSKKNFKRLLISFENVLGKDIILQVGAAKKSGRVIESKF
jgi:hypothetical protein